MVRLSLVAALLALSLPGAPRPVPRECGAPGSVCAEFDRAGSVFLATVAKVSVVYAEQQRGPLRLQSVIFDVLEGFKGTTSGQVTMTFNSALAEERVFSDGETVLVYAQRSASRTLWTVGCSRTRRVEPDDRELVTLRELMRQTLGAAVEGNFQVLEGVRPPALPPTTPLGGLGLTVESLDRTEAVTVSSQAGGYFLVPWLAAGRYRIRFDSDLYVPVVRDFVIAPRTRCLSIEPITLKLR